MNTPAHIVINLMLLAKEERKETVAPVVAGAVLPDLPIMAFYAYAKLVRGLSEQAIWAQTYYAAGWQIFFDIFNSLPLIAAGYLAARWAKARRLALLFASMALHCAGDLLLHHDDAHRHFFPFSDWRFHSPVSYWDPQYFGHIAAPLEAVVVVAGSLYLLRRYASLKGRMLAGGLAAVYAVYWGYALWVWA